MSDWLEWLLFSLILGGTLWLLGWGVAAVLPLLAWAFYYCWEGTE